MVKITDKSKDKHKGVNSQKKGESASGEGKPPKEKKTSYIPAGKNKDYDTTNGPDFYIKVASILYKIIFIPLSSGDIVRVAVKWSIAALKEDWKSMYSYNCELIEKYNAFVLVPDHINYSRKINNCYNRYEPLPHVPCPGNCSTILAMIKHIFGEQYELGLDYIQLLYKRPLQKLPILLLVSSQRNTGKTTFLNFLKYFFGDNSTFISNSDMRSQFNSDWLNKLIVFIDELLLDQRSDSERFKSLSTATTSKIEAKGVDRTEFQVYAKFILASNNELNPVIIDPGETRWWVRKVEPLSKDRVDYPQALKSEIPAFMDYLLKRKLSTDDQNRGRMHFRPDEIYTEALNKIMSGNRSQLEQEMIQGVGEILDILRANNIKEFQFTARDLLELIKESYPKITKSAMTKVLKENWCLKPANPPAPYKRYKIYLHTNSIDSHMTETLNGRFYTIDIEQPPHFFVNS